MTEPLVITVAKADPTGRDPIRSATLRISGELPQSVGAESSWRRAAVAAYKDDAARIVRALNSLPQGTLDQLLMLLLERRASLLRVPVLDTEGPEEADNPNATKLYELPALEQALLAAGAVPHWPAPRVKEALLRRLTGVDPSDSASLLRILAIAVEDLVHYRDKTEGAAP